MLYANSPIPLYQQLYHYFRKAIDEGELSVGVKLPSERQIAAEYGISRITARKALVLLRDEGYVRAFQGKGAFVSQSVEHSYTHIAVKGFSEVIRSRGMIPTSKLLSCGIVPVSGEIARYLAIPDYDKAIRIRRLRLANGVPLALDTAYLSYPRCAAILQANLEKHSLYWTLQKVVGIQLGHADQALQSILMSDGDIQLLKLEPPTAMVQLKRQTYDTAGQVVEYVEAIHREDINDPKVFVSVTPS